MRTLLCLLFAPRYLRDMPADRPGTFEAVAATQSPWYRATRAVERVSGLRAAYRRARWLALKLDWSLPGSASGEVGVVWQVREVAP